MDARTTAFMHKFCCRCTSFRSVVLQSCQAIDEFQIALRNLRVSTTEGTRAHGLSSLGLLKRAAGTSLAPVFSVCEGRPLGRSSLFSGSKDFGLCPHRGLFPLWAAPRNAAKLLAGPCLAQ